MSRFRKVYNNAICENNIANNIPSLLENNTSQFLSNDVKLSILADIGKSSFTYDMRNIKEVFVFPKIWYRRSLVRRVFLGDDSQTANTNNMDNTMNNNSSYPSKNINSDKEQQQKYDDSFNSANTHSNSEYDDTLSSPGEFQRRNFFLKQNLT